MYMSIKIAEIHSTITLQLFTQGLAKPAEVPKWSLASRWSLWGLGPRRLPWWMRLRRMTACAARGLGWNQSWWESLGCFSRRKQGNKMMTSASPESQDGNMWENFSRHVNVPIGIWHQNNQTETARWHRWTWKLSEIVQSYRFMAQVIRVPARNAWGPHLTGFHFVCMCAFMSSKKRHTKQPNMPTDLKNRGSKDSPKALTPRNPVRLESTPAQPVGWEFSQLALAQQSNP